MNHNYFKNAIGIIQTYAGPLFVLPLRTSVLVTGLAEDQARLVTVLPVVPVPHVVHAHGVTATDAPATTHATL